MLNDFKEHSGLEINTTKTEAMWLGEWKKRTDERFGFKWPKEPINALGVFFSYNQASANRLNFAEKILNLEKTLKTWQRRNLTLYGKINIVKTLGISNFGAPCPRSLYPRNKQTNFQLYLAREAPYNHEKKHHNWRKEGWRTENV